MALTYLGSVTVGDMLPSLDAAIGISLPELEIKLSAMLAAAIELNLHPPTIAASLSLALQLVAEIQASISIGIELPSLSLQLSFIASFVAALNLQIGILLAFQASMGTAGVHAYAWDGEAASLGPAVPTSFPGGAPTDHTNALLMVTAVPAAWAAIAALMKTS